MRIRLSVIFMAVVFVIIFAMYKGDNRVRSDTNIGTAVCAIDTAPISISELSIYKSAINIGELNEYIVGVVAAEMPVSYGVEALKAQAVAARTYALRAMEGNSDLNYSNIGQAYISEAVMKKRWGSNYNIYIDKIRQAVNSTQDIIITYDDKPILAAFCASSGGMTEQSSNVWNQGLPYLVSVDSHWDIDSADYTDEVSFSRGELNNILGGVPEIGRRSQAGYVQLAYVGKKAVSGMEIREKLKLKSANFDISREGDRFCFKTKGYGHGVGMSQVGAGAMAKEGYSFDEILLHYYPNTNFSKIKCVLK